MNSKSSTRPRRIAGVVGVWFGLVLGSVIVASPAQAGSAGASTATTTSAVASATTVECQTANRRVARARAALTRAKRLLQRSRTPAAKRRARKRVKQAKKRLRAALRSQATACERRPVPPVAPRVGPPPGPPPQPPVPPAANRSPQWPSPTRSTVSTQFQYDPVTGFLVGAVTTITVLTPPVDPDGDPLTYTWTASNGTIDGQGLTATWTRVISLGRPQSGQVRLVATDGKGGTATFTFNIS